MPVMLSRLAWRSGLDDGWLLRAGGEAAKAREQSADEQAIWPPNFHCSGYPGKKIHQHWLLSVEAPHLTTNRCEKRDKVTRIPVSDKLYLFAICRQSLSGRIC